MKNIARILYTLIASVMLLVLIIILIFIIVKVVPSYTESADRTVNAVSSLIRKDSYTPEDVNFIVALEYESLSTRLVVTQILAGLTIGLCICIIGLMLFGLGVSQPVEAEASGGSWKVTLKNASPGLVVIVVGGILIAFGIARQMTRSFEASYDGVKKAKISGGDGVPRSTGKGIDLNDPEPAKQPAPKKQ